jgi:hypothetical protein
MWLVVLFRAGLGCRGGGRLALRFARTLGRAQQQVDDLVHAAALALELIDLFQGLQRGAREVPDARPSFSSAGRTTGLGKMPSEV